MLKAGYNAFLSGNTAANRKMGIPDTPALQPANDGETAGMTAAPLVVAAGIPEIEPEAAGAAEATLLGAARDARDAMASEVGKKVATVTAGYNTETGAVAAACSGGGVCAEANVVKALGGDANKVKFTEAVRPRTGNEVPVCTSCEAQYGKRRFRQEQSFRAIKSSHSSKELQWASQEANKREETLTGLLWIWTVILHISQRLDSNIFPNP